jgi:hypothetical protein
VVQYVVLILADAAMVDATTRRSLIWACFWHASSVADDEGVYHMKFTGVKLV